MMEIVGWMVWSMVALLSFLYTWGCRQYANRGELFHWGTGFNTILLCIVSILFVFINSNKLHLIWIVPAVRIITTITVVIRNYRLLSFIILNSKVFFEIILFGVKRPSDYYDRIVRYSFKDKQLYIKTKSHKNIA